MPESKSICGVIIADLLTNGDQIDENDPDFKIVLKQFEEMEDAASGSNEIPLSNGSKASCLDNTKVSPAIPNATSLKRQNQPDFCQPNHKKMKNNQALQGIEIFPVKLFKILDRSDVCGYSPIISWPPNGEAFKIHNENLFKEKIMKQCFFQTEIKSFKHQLHVYGFQKIGKRHADAGAYFHHSFKRGRIEACGTMIRHDSNVATNANRPPIYDSREFIERVEELTPNEASIEVCDEPALVKCEVAL